ncbi:hypothetical protein [Nonomuraea rhizosphaerae]|uniref:hypothetical protein n=1 Tax=Nonomuraea rhizosphaerae TaxID=2665663 RepID=UPI001C5D83C9|nr:hypothetical protein [Nonomuraea rhizosphaerae]
MSDLEARLRAALHAKAETFEAAPDAWLAVQRRTPSPPPRGRWLAAALPIALIAVFVPILLNGGLGRNSANDPSELYRSLMRELTPAGQEVVFDDPATGRPVRLWFARTEVGAPELCKIIEPVDGDPYGWCGDLRFEEGRAVMGVYDGTTRTDSPGPYVDYGVATNDVVEVTAVLEDGRRVEATQHRSDDAPLMIWTLPLSAGQRVSKVQVTDAKGRQGPDASPYFRQQSHRETPIGQSLRLPGGVTVRPYEDKVQGRKLYWFRGGEEVGLVNLEGKNANPPGASWSENGLIYAARPKDTARIEVVFGAEAPITLTGSEDPWNLGLNLFTAARSRLPDWRLGSTTTGYDAAGKQVWRTSVPPYKKKEEVEERRIGETMTVPGTEDFTDGPVRLFFGERPALGRPPEDGVKEVMLCAEGGANSNGRQEDKLSATCGQLHSPMGGFTRREVQSFLPLPGNVVAFGVADDDWLSVDAVLDDGTRVHGTVTRGKDTPRPVWWVKYPRTLDGAVLAFKLRGKRIEQVQRTNMWCWEAKKPVAAGQPFGGGLVANMHDGTCLKWWQDGKEQPGSFQPAPGGKLSDLIAAGERPLRWSAGRERWYGFALPGTARVEFTRRDGGAISTETTVDDPWSQGVRLFEGPLPKAVAKQGLFWPGIRFTGYAADGRVLWTYEPKGRDD